MFRSSFHKHDDGMCLKAYFSFCNPLSIYTLLCGVIGLVALVWLNNINYYYFRLFVYFICFNIAFVLISVSFVNVVNRFSFRHICSEKKNG
jgi:hypothetical protein